MNKPLFPAVEYIISIAVLISLFCIPIEAQAPPNNPNRGFHPAGSYSLGEVETINTVNGNLILQTPLGSLPPGRAGLSASLRLTYNGKLWDSFVNYFYNGGNYYTENLLYQSPEGGWRYSYQYQLQAEHRPLDPSHSPCQDAEDRFVHRVKMSFPDGSTHVFRIYGYQEMDGYSEMRNDGWMNSCNGSGYVPVTTGTLTYYSIDGSFLRLDIDHDSDGMNLNNPWTLYYPNGMRVTGGGTANQRIHDRNGNYVEIQNYVDSGTGRPVTKLVDQFNREIKIDYGTAVNQDSVIYTGFGGATATTTVKWKYITINKSYDSLPSDGSISFAGFYNYSMRVIDQVVLPSQAGGNAYTFGYDSINMGGYTGWGGVNAITLPTGAQVAYTYNNDTAVGGYWYDVLRIHPKTKSLNYAREYDGSSTWGPAETTTFLRGNGTSQTTNPDGGVLKVYFAEAGTGGIILYDQLVYKTEQPDGAVVERKWQLNKPNIPHAGNFNTADTVNAYVKTEFTSVRNAAGTLSKTAIRDYTYDKNGNVTQVNEYDWVDYGSVARDGNGNPTGAIPGGAVIKRVLVNTWHNPTPAATDSTTNDPDTYCKPTSPRLKNAVESNEVRSDTPTSGRLRAANTLTTILRRREIR
ncbi:MAG: hypothetical protein KIT57_07510 [Blastocatellales bacterium]|nr:hypothetical protein [Blastocatellales bacterium]